MPRQGAENRKSVTFNSGYKQPGRRGSQEFTNN